MTLDNEWTVEKLFGLLEKNFELTETFRFLCEVHNAALSALSAVRAVLTEECETDTLIRDLVRPIIGEFNTDGDSYGVPGLSDITESLITIILDLRDQLAKSESTVVAERARADNNADIADSIARASKQTEEYLRKEIFFGARSSAEQE